MNKKYKLSKKRWRDKNKYKIAKDSEEYRQKNRLIINKKRKEYVLLNKEKVKKYNIERKKKIKRIIASIKRIMFCVQCGRKDTRFLLFHHKNPKDKAFCVAEAPSRTLSSALQEIEKCNVLCYSCHKTLHNKIKRRAKEHIGEE